MNGQKGFFSIIITGILLIILILGGYYFYTTGKSQIPAKAFPQPTTVAVQEPTVLTPTVVPTLQQSDTIQAINEDMQTTQTTELDKDLADLQKESQVN